MYKRVCVCIYICVCVCVCVCVYVCMSECVYVCVLYIWCMCMCVCTYACMYLCMYVWRPIYVHIYVRKFRLPPAQHIQLNFVWRNLTKSWRLFYPTSIHYISYCTVLQIQHYMWTLLYSGRWPCTLSETIRRFGGRKTSIDAASNPKLKAVCCRKCR
jgi:hypothetical protein